MSCPVYRAKEGWLATGVRCIELSFELTLSVMSYTRSTISWSSNPMPHVTQLIVGIHDSDLRPSRFRFRFRFASRIVKRETVKSRRRLGHIRHTARQQQVNRSNI